MLRAIRVAEIADSGQTYGGHAYHDCLGTAAEDHVPIVYPRAGDVWRTSDGSAYSSSAEFVDAVRPRYAIISVGRHNLFGHPAPSTIDRLQRSAVMVYRTDESGAATVVTDGRRADLIGDLRWRFTQLITVRAG